MVYVAAGRKQCAKRWMHSSTFSPFSTSIRSQALTWVACCRKCRSWSSSSELHLLIKASSWAYDITGAVLNTTRIWICTSTLEKTHKITTSQMWTALYLVVTTAVEVDVKVPGAVDAAVFSPREKPVVAPVLAAATKDTNTCSNHTNNW